MGMPEGVAELVAGNWVAVDVEGDGNAPQVPVEVAVVRYEGLRPVRSSSWLVDPGRPMDPYVTRIHGLTDADLEGRPSFPEIARDFAAEVEGLPMVGHAVLEDLAMISRVMPHVSSLPSSVIDVQRLARNLLQGRKAYRLDALVADFGAAPEASPSHRGGFHSAAWDAEAAGNLFVKLAAMVPASGRMARHYARACTVPPDALPRPAERETPRP